MLDRLIKMADVVEMAEMEVVDLRNADEADAEDLDTRALVRLYLVR